VPFLNRLGSGSTRKFGFGAGMAPGAPTIGTATRGNAQVSVAFTAPTMVGTGTPTYTATSSPGSFTASGSGSPLVVTGLANGTAYTFTVTASNPFGSATSAASNSVTPATTPGAPTSVTATPGNVSAAVSWTAPASNGDAITDYVVQYSSNSGSSWTTFADGTSSSTSATVTGLANGTSYVFQVAATNSVGTGSYSTASSAVTPRTVPGAPASVTSTPSNGSVSIAFTAPSSDGGSAVTSYQYSTDNSTFVTAATNPFTVSGTNGTAITVYVRAVNVAGAGASTSATSTPRTVPDQVGTPTSSLGDRRFTISWTVPGNGGSAITGYRVQYSTNGGSTWTGDATTASTSYTFTLANGTSYVGRVQAINVAGDGAYSAASTARTPTFAAPGVSVANIAGYPNTGDINTWAKRPIRITFSPTVCENYRDTYVYVIHGASEYATGQTLGPYTSSSANQTIDVSTWSSVFGGIDIALDTPLSITVTTYNSENHGVAATTTHNTGAGVTHYTYDSQTWTTDEILVTGTTFSRTFYDWTGSPSQSVRSAQVYARINETTFNTVSASRNPSLGLSANGVLTGIGGGSISLRNLPNGTAADWPVGGTVRTKNWNHTDLNTDYSATTNGQRYSIAGGGDGTLAGLWGADSRINTYLVITYEQRTTWTI
jgi:hypothetical protein